MKVFYLITELDPGGAERMLYELVKRLDRERFEPTVGCLRGRGEVGGWIADLGVEIIYFDMRSCLDWGALRRVAAELRRREVDMLHTVLFHANTVGRLAARAGGVKRVVSSVRVEEKRRLHLWLDGLTQMWMDIETCVSESTRNYTHERARIPMSKLVVIPNGVDVARFEDLPRPPAEWRLPAEGPVVATVARLDEQKNPLGLLRAFADAWQYEPRATLAWAGAGPMLGQVRKEAERLGLSKSLRLLGSIPDVRPLLGRADIFALNSRWEGMPNCVLEAMACGLPVIATAVGGCAELIEHGKTGYLAPPGDAQAMSGGLCRLMDSASLRRRMGEAGRERARSEFTLDAMVKKNEAVYERLLRKV